MAQTRDPDIDTLGFPVGYFIIKSAATGRVFDVYLDEIEDGTDIILAPEKEKSMVESEFHFRSNRICYIEGIDQILRIPRSGNE